MRLQRDEASALNVWLGERFGYGFFRAALGFEDELDDFAGGTSPAGAARDEVADGGELWRAIGYADGQTGALR